MKRVAQWATTQCTIHGLQSPETMKNDKANYKELSELAEQANKHAEVARNIPAESICRDDRSNQSTFQSAFNTVSDQRT